MQFEIIALFSSTQVLIIAMNLRVKRSSLSQYYSLPSPDSHIIR